MSTSLSQAPFQPGPPARLPSQCGLDHFSAPRHVQPAPRTGDGGIDQFAREDAVVAAGEEKPDVVEFAALGLVDRTRVVRGKSGSVRLDPGVRRIIKKIKKHAG